MLHYCYSCKKNDFLCKSQRRRRAATTTYYFVKTLKDSCQYKTNSCCCCLPAAHTTQTQLIILCYYIFCKILSLSAAAAAKVTRDAFWPGELMQHIVSQGLCVCVFVFNIKKPTLLYWRRRRRPTVQQRKLNYLWALVRALLLFTLLNIIKQCKTMRRHKMDFILI